MAQPTSIRLGDDLLEQLEQKAKEEDFDSTSECIREILRRVVVEDEIDMAQQLETLTESHEQLYADVRRIQESQADLNEDITKDIADIQGRLQGLKRSAGQGGDGVGADELREFAEALRDHQEEQRSRLEDELQKSRGAVEDLEKRVRNLERRVNGVAAGVNELEDNLEDEFDERRQEHESLFGNQETLQREVGQVRQTSAETKRRVGELQRTRTERALGWLKARASALQSRLPIMG